jgi:hypothetical protein
VKEAAHLFFLAGAGIVSNPLPKPAIPLVSIQSGNVTAQTIFVQTAWVDAGGNESALSAVNGLVLPDNSSIAVAMSEGALGAPAAAAGWNVYAGTDVQAMTRQNVAALALGSAWDMPGSGLMVGAKPLNGQQPDYYIVLPNEIRRG